MQLLIPRLGLIALAAGFNYLVWLWVGSISFAVCSPLYACIVARPVIELLSGSYRFTRKLALRKISGRHFAHRGVMIDIVEDGYNYRWLRVDDVRKFVNGLPDDRSLKRRHPDGIKIDESFPRKMRIEAETLGAFLKLSNDPSAIKFKQWLEKDVAFPARTIRERRPSNN